MNDNKRNLYDALSQEYDLGTFEQFEKDLADSGKRKNLYDAVINDYDLGDFSSFEKQLGFAQQAQSAPQAEAEPQQGFFDKVKGGIADAAKQAMQKPRGGENGYTFTAEELGIAEGNEPTPAPVVDVESAYADYLKNGGKPFQKVRMMYDKQKRPIGTIVDDAYAPTLTEIEGWMAQHPADKKEEPLPGEKAWWQSAAKIMGKEEAEPQMYGPMTKKLMEEQRMLEEQKAVDEKDVEAVLPYMNAVTSLERQNKQTVQGVFDSVYKAKKGDYPAELAEELTSGLMGEYSKERENRQSQVEKDVENYSSARKWALNPYNYGNDAYGEMQYRSGATKLRKADELDMMEEFAEDAKKRLLTDEALKAKAQENADMLGMTLEKYVDEVAVPILQNRMYSEWLSPQEEKAKKNYNGVIAAAEGSLIGTLFGASRTNTEKYLSQVGQEAWRKDASLFGRAAAGAGSMFLDLPAFMGWGSLAAVPAKAVGGQVFKQLAKNETKRLVARGVAEGAAQRYANYAVRNGLKNRILLNLSTAPLQSGLTFGMFDAGKAALNMSLNGEWDWKELGKSALGGALMGGALGATGAVGGGLTHGLTGATKAAAKVAEFGVENAVFTEGGRLIGKLHGQQPENGWLEDYVESGATLLMIKAPNIVKNVSAIKGDKEASEVFAFNRLEREQLGKYGEDLNSVLESLLPQSKRVFEDGLKINEGTFTEEYRRVMSDPEVSMTTKAKLMGIVEGKVMPAPRVVDAKIEGNRVMTYDPMGRLVEVKEYATEAKANAEYKKVANAAEVESIAVLEDVYMRIKGYEADELTVKEWLAKNPKVTMERVAEIVAKNSAGEKLTEAEQKILESLRQARREGLNDVRHLNDVLAGLDVDAKDVMSGIDKPIDKRTERENRAVRAYTDVLSREVKDKIQEPYRRGEAQRAADDVWRAANNVKWANEDVKLLADRIYESDRQIDETANDGMVYTTTTPSGEKVIITGGKVVLDNEGYIDVNQSEGLVALMPDGTKKPVRVDELREKIEVSNAEELKAAKREEIVESAIGGPMTEPTADASQNGNLVPGAEIEIAFEGEIYKLKVDGRDERGDIILSGEGASMAVPESLVQEGMKQAETLQAENQIEVAPVEVNAENGDKVETAQPIEQPGLSNGLSNETAPAVGAQPQVELTPKQKREEVLNRIPMKGKERAWTEAEPADVVEYISLLTNDPAKQQAAVDKFIADIKAKQEKVDAITALEMDEDIAFWDGVKQMLAEKAEPVAEVAPVESAPVAEEAQPIEVVAEQPIEQVAEQKKAAEELADAQAFVDADTQGTVEAYAEYINKFPNGVGVPAAEYAIEKLQGSKAAVEGQVAPAVENKPKIKGRKQVEKAVERMRKADAESNAVEVLNAITTAETNAKRGDEGAITPEEQAEIDALKKKYAEQGYEVVDIVGMEYDDEIGNISESEQAKIGQKYILGKGTDFQVYNEEDVLVVNGVKKPLIVKNGEIVQQADALIGPKGGGVGDLSGIEKVSEGEDKAERGEKGQKAVEPTGETDSSTLSQTSGQVAEGDIPDSVLSGLWESREDYGYSEDVAPLYDALYEALPESHPVSERGKYIRQLIETAKKYNHPLAKAILENVAEGGNAPGQSGVAEAEVAPKKRVPLNALEIGEVAVERSEERNEEQRRVPLRARTQEWTGKLGVPIKVHESIETVTNREAKRRLENDDNIDGWFNVADGSVEIYLPNVEDVAQVDKVYLHEVVGHKGLRELMGEKYDALCDSAWSVMDSKAQKNFLEYVGAVDENGMVLENPSLKQMREAADEYMAWMAQNVDYETNKELWQPLIDSVREFFESLGMGATEGEKGASPFVMSDADIADLIKASYANLASKASVSSVTEAAENADDAPIMASVATERELQERIKAYAESKEGKKAGWTPEKVESITEETEALIGAIDAAMRGNEFYDAFADRQPTIRTDWRDGEAKPTVTWTRGNVEYKYDMSADLLCINNDGIEEVLSSPRMVELMASLPTKSVDGYDLSMTGDDYMTLYGIMREMGFVVPCKGCFDAAARFKMLPSVAQKFAADVNRIVDERNADPEAFDAKVRAMAKGEATVEGLPVSAKNKEQAIMIGVAGDKLTEHISWTQLMTDKGQTKMLADLGGVFRAWERTGAGRPKDKLQAEPYYGDIVSQMTTIIGKYGEKTPAYRDIQVNTGTGLRRNSHSEFRPVLAVDEIQFMRDAFIKGLTVFKYMKELDDVRLFGQMGVKYNMSFFPEHVKGAKVSGLDVNGDYIASEESVGAREFPYTVDGKKHYDGMKGWEEAQKMVNENVSLSSVVFSVPHLIKAMTDVPTVSDKSGLWGSLIPFHSSGATTGQLAAQGLGTARANGVGHSFEEAMYDYGKGVTNFEQVQNDRFGEGWVIVSGKKAGEAVEPGHKLEFVNGNHYYNEALGVHLFPSGYALDAEVPAKKRRELDNARTRGKYVHPFSVDYNEKVREIGSPTAYKEAADYYLEMLPKLGLVPRFQFEVDKATFLQMCADAKVDPKHPKLGWKGESWSPTDAESYYSLFCDYGMTDPKTGDWSPHRPVGFIDENGERVFRLPENAVEIAKNGLERYSEVRRRENAKVDEVIDRFEDAMREQGRLPEVDGEMDAEVRFSRVFGGNSGYVGYSMSKRAAEARAEGRFPKTDFKKEYGVTDKELKALVDAGIVSDREWHHTSMYGNKTTFYGFENKGAIDFFNENKDRVKEAVKNGTLNELAPEFKQAAEAFEDAEFEEAKRDHEEWLTERSLKEEYDKYINTLPVPEEFTASNGVRVVSNGSRKSNLWEYYRPDGSKMQESGKGYREFERFLESNQPSFEEWKAKRDAKQDVLELIQPFAKEKREEEDIRFRFIGKKGAENLDKTEEATTRLDNLNVAREMETGGKDAKSIKLATGWERGADGKWRYETEDVKVNRGAELFSLETYKSYPIAGAIEIGRVDENSTIKLTSLVKDDELFKAYPEMEEYYVSFEKMPAETKGSHSFEEKMIRINKDDISGLNSTLVHEIQHAIQSIEGFARGGNTESVATRAQALRGDVRPLYDMMLETPEWAEKKRLVNRWLAEEDKAEPDRDYQAQLWERIEEINNSGVLDDIQQLQDRLIKKYGLDRTVTEIISGPYAMDAEVWSNLPESFYDKYDAYKRLAGEVEARNVQERMGMTAEERRNSLAEETYMKDVAKEDQTFIFDNLGVSSSQEVAPEQDIPVGEVESKPLTFAEKITNSVLEASAKNKENLALRSDALRMFGRDVANVLKLMGKQREYDKSTVDQLVKLAKMYFKDAQLLGGLTPYQVGRVMTRLNNAVGKRDITDDANELVNILVDAHNKELEKMLEKQAKTKAKKVNASGVEVIGKLDKEGQLLLEEYNNSKVLDLKSIDDKIIDLQTSGKLEGENGEVERETAAKIRGLELARQYREEILAKQTEIKGLEQELKSAEQDAKDGAMDRAAYKEFRRATERAILESKLEMVDAYHGLIHGLGGDISSSAKRAKLFQQQQIDHVKEIQHNANSDLLGHPAEAQGETPDKWNSSVPRLFMSAMPTFQTMLKFFGEKAADGRGYLYERFIPQHTQASHNEYIGKTEAREKMRDKLTEIFGKKTTIENFMDMSRKEGAILEYQEGGQKKTIDLTRGQVLYLYMINKMADGQMKLSRMGITDADVQKMANELPEEFVRFADWVQEEFLTELRDKYNAVHERMFGAPMAAIESYFPIKINKRSRGEKIEPGMNAEDKPSTVTGSVIKRTKNAVAIDLSADAMQVLLGHIDDMENWAAWAEFRRDLKSLLNYRHFQNQVKGMESLRYGSGEKLWKNFVDVANIAAGSFKPSSTAADRAVRNIAKGVVSSKIAFRYFTALKQILSTPAFWSEVDFGKMMNAYLHQKEAWDWAMKNLPGFSKRWEGRASGNEILLESDADWKVWQNRAVQWLSKEGMRANAFIDALTVATGAKAVFETKYEMFKKAGYSEERAREKALNRAAEAYNESQQSSESAYLSPLQAEATFVSSVLTAYRNSPFGYNRKMATAIANLKKKMKKGFKQESIEYMIKQLMRDGLNEEQAKKFAKSTYRRSVARDAADVALYEFFLNYVWVLGPSLIYILGGDDDEKKKELNVEALIDGAMGGLGNLPAGETLTGAIKAIAEGDVSNFKLPQAVAMQDMETIADLMQTDPVRAAGEVLNILVAMGVGVNPQTFTDMFVALAGTEDWSDPREIAMLVLRLINAPNSKLELLEADEAMENYGANIEEITREYAEYQKSKRAPLTGWLYSDESEQKAIERYEKRFKKILDERFEVVVENTDEYDMWYENSDPQMKAKLAKLRQKFLEGDKETTMEKLDSIDVTKKVLFGSGYDEVNTVYYELSTAEDEDMAMMIDTKLKELTPMMDEYKKLRGDERKAYREENLEQIQFYNRLNAHKNNVNNLKGAMKKKPEEAQEKMEKIRKIRTKAIDLINNYNE